MDILKDGLEDDNLAGFRRDFENFVDATQWSRYIAEQCTDFNNLKQWTDDEEKVIRSRNQIPVVFDYFAENVEMVVAIERDSRTDPKAYPRTKAHEDAAYCITDALRYISDNNDFQDVASQVFEDVILRGYGAVKVEVEEKKKGKITDFEVKTRRIAWDRFYFDPASRCRYFSDASYMGIVVWMTLSEAKRLYNDKAKEIDGIREHGFGSDTFDDKPAWYDSRKGRIKVCEHYFMKDGKWHFCHFTGETYLIDPKPCDYVDEFGEPSCPIKAVSVYVDRDNHRLPYAQRWLDPQREVNHRRSKALFLLSSRQVIAEEGAVKSQHAFIEELKKPDGYAEVNPGALRDGAIQISQTGDMASGQLAMYQDAVTKMDTSGANAALQGEVSGMSGAAIGKLQAGGALQLGALFDSFRKWKRDTYREMWFRVKQFWDDEKWIRVTDDEDCLEWVGLNYKVTLQDALTEKAEKGDEQAIMMLQQLTQMGDPRLQTVIETRNNVQELDMDIILDEGPDTINVQQEQFAAVVDLAKAYPDRVPFEAVLELMTIPNKSRIREIIEPKDDPMAEQMAQMQAQLQQMQIQLGMQQMQADIENKQADTAKKVADTQATNAKTQQTMLETQLAAMFPDLKPNVVI